KLDKFEVGDILLLNDFYTITEAKEKIDTVFHTSEQIKVISVEQVEKKIDGFGNTLNKQARRLKNSNYYESKYKIFSEQINKETTRSYKCWKLCVEKISVDDVDD